MTRNVELLLVTEMNHEDSMEVQLENIGYFDESVDSLCGIDPETGEMDPDSGMLFPQPIK